jgi:hypothetical protein
MIRAMRALGLVWDVRIPADSALRTRRVSAEVTPAAASST